MKILLVLFTLVTSAFAQDKPLTDEERTRASLAVFTGTVISCGFDKRVKGVDYYIAVIRVESIEKADRLLRTNPVTLIYSAGTKIDPGQKVKCWCISWDYGGKRVLSIPRPSWMKPADMVIQEVAPMVFRVVEVRKEGAPVNGKQITVLRLSPLAVKSRDLSEARSKYESAALSLVTLVDVGYEIRTNEWFNLQAVRLPEPVSTVVAPGTLRTNGFPRTEP